MRHPIRQQQTTTEGYPYDLVWTDRGGVQHWTLFKIGGDCQGFAKWDSTFYLNPYCGCHLSMTCRLCGACTNCDMCYCEQH